MARHSEARTLESSDLQTPLIDRTEALALRSRKTDRKQRKLGRKPLKDAASEPHLLALTMELLLDVLSYLRPSDIFRFQRTCKAVRDFVSRYEAYTARVIAKFRYPSLSRCFPRPVALEDVDAIYHDALLDEHRQTLLGIHRRPYAHHIAPHDPDLVCSCLTCILAWNNLCLIVDLAYWTDEAIARGKAITTIPRGQTPTWNVELLGRHAAVVRRALTSPLWYLAILQRHLSTTASAIRRYAPRGGNTQAATAATFGLTLRDETDETDAFCAREGPPSYEFPLTRDAYYGLQAYLPNRGWKETESRWRYMPDDQHFTDLRWVLQQYEAKKLERGGSGLERR